MLAVTYISKFKPFEDDSEREEPDKAEAEERNKKIQQLISCVQKAASTSRNPTRRQCGSARNQHVKREPPHTPCSPEDKNKCAKDGRQGTMMMGERRTDRRTPRELIITYSHFARRPPEKATRNELKLAGIKRCAAGVQKLPLRLSLSLSA